MTDLKDSTKQLHKKKLMIEFKNVSKHFKQNLKQTYSVKELLITYSKKLFLGLLGPFRKKVKKNKPNQMLQQQSPSQQIQQVFNDINFQVYAGDFLGIIGHNGAGKSTILKIISQIYIPSKGEVNVYGKIAPLLELGAGFTDELSGVDNIYLTGAIFGLSGQEIKQNLASIITFSELGEKIYGPVRYYSSGMVVRLAFSIAIHLNAPILLFDEVLAVGDQSFQKKCIEKIRQLHQEGKAIILVTHDHQIIKNFCNRCIVMGNKQKLFDGDPVLGINFYEQLAIKP